MQAARQLLLSLFGGAGGGGGQARGRDFGGGRANRRQYLGGRPRDGEWACQCGFATNRQYREACHQCGRARDVAEVGCATGTFGAKGLGGRALPEGKGHKGKGPIGAGGNRPLLGGRGGDQLGGKRGRDGGKGVATATAPTSACKGIPPWGHGGKTDGGGKLHHGKSGKGATKAGLGTASGNCGKGEVATGWTRPPTVCDEDGYQLVQPRRIRVGKGDPKGDVDATATVGGADQRTYAAVARRRWSDDADSDDDGMEDLDGGDEGDGCGGDEGGTWEADPRELRAAFEEHARAAKELEKRGNFGPALETLQMARDEAERRWREAKPPAPLPKRLEWADGKLRKAQAALTRVRMELDAFDEEANRRRAEICNRIHEAEQWCQWRKQQLDKVHEEAAECAPGRRGGAARTEDAGTREIRRKIRGQMLPEMQAILEEVPEGSGLHERLSLFAAGLADAEANLAEWQEQGGPTMYDMGDGDSQDDWGDEERDDTNDDDGQRQGPNDGGVESGPKGWRPEGASRWTRTGVQRAADQQAAHGATTEGGSKGTAQGTEVRGTGSAGALGDERTANAGCTTGGAEAGDSDTARAGKHRRRHTAAEAERDERAESDNRRADELRRQLAQATAAQERSYQEGKGGFGSEAALSAAAQGFVLQVQRAQAQAHERGIEPVAADGRTLLELSPAELVQWETDNLRDDQMHE